MVFSMTASLLPQVSISSVSELFSILYSISELFSLLLAKFSRCLIQCSAIGRHLSNFLTQLLISVIYILSLVLIVGVNFWVSMWVVGVDNHQPPMDYVGSGSLQILSPSRKNREQRSKMLNKSAKRKMKSIKKSPGIYIFWLQILHKKHYWIFWQVLIF